MYVKNVSGAKAPSSQNAVNIEYFLYDDTFMTELFCWYYGIEPKYLSYEFLNDTTIILVITNFYHETYTGVKSITLGLRDIHLIIANYRYYHPEIPSLE